ncbi:MAG: CPBP family intramembrane glutamic endopeptidase, partial [Verrucomicrobiota bacterium]
MLSEKPWRIECVLLFGAAQFVCLCLGLTIAALLHKAGVNGFQGREDFGNLVFATISFQGAAWLLIWIFLRMHQAGFLAAFGWRGPKLKSALLTAVIFILVVLPVVLLLQGASVYILEKLGWPHEDQVAVEMLLSAKGWFVTTYFGVFAIVIAPVAEEFIFRGMLFPFVRQLGYPKLAWFGVSALFALIHMNAPAFIALFVLALALTWLY